MPDAAPKKIQLSYAEVTEDHKAAAMRALTSGRYILGPECKAFEEELAKFFGVPCAALCTSGTSAITLPLIAMGLKPGDEVIVPSLTAFPTPEGVYNAGLKAVYADIDDLYGMDPSHVRSLVGPRTVGIMPVHLYGQPVDLEPLRALAASKNLFFAEDNCQAHGAKIGERRTGSFGKFAALSFYFSKNLTVFGDVGAVLTSDAEIDRQVRKLRDHGRQEKYTHERVGFNLRFNEIQAALGRVSLERLEAGNESRRRSAALYRKLLTGVPGVQLPKERPGTTHVYHLFVIRIPNRDGVAAKLKAQNIETGIHYPVPNHLQPAVAKMGPQAPLPRTEKAVNEILSLPMFPSLKEEDVARVAAAIKAAI